MQKKYLIHKYRAGADYIPELNGYVVDDVPEGEAFEELDVYNVEIRDSLKEQDPLSAILKQHKAKVAFVTVAFLLLGFAFGRMTK